MRMSLCIPVSAASAVLAAATAVPVTAQSNPDVVEVSAAAQQRIDAEELHLPAGEWRLTGAGSGCAVTRDFVRDGSRIALSLRRLQPGLPVQYALIGSGFSEEEPVEAGFVPGTGLARYTRLAGARIGAREGFVFAGNPFPRGEGSEPDEDVLAPRTQDFVIQGEESAPIVLHTGSIEQPLETLSQCAIRHLESQGVDVAARGSYSRRPSVTNDAHLQAALRVAYPGGAIRDRRQGPVWVRVIVGPDGAVTGCDVGSHLTARVLREAACNTIRDTAEHQPALDGAGLPVTDFYLTQVIFHIAPTPGF